MVEKIVMRRQIKCDISGAWVRQSVEHADRGVVKGAVKGAVEMNYEFGLSKAITSFLPPTVSEIMESTKKVVSSPEFSRSKAAQAFLEYVVKEAVEGRGSAIKAFTIAIDALKRDVDFDPQKNSTIRTVAKQVRTGLADYYASTGRFDEIRISIELGNYCPIFQYAARRPMAEVSQESTNDNQKARRSFLRAVRVGFGLICMGTMLWFKHGAIIAQTKILATIIAAFVLCVGFVVRVNDTSKQNVASSESDHALKAPKQVTLFTKIKGDASQWRSEGAREAILNIIKTEISRYDSIATLTNDSSAPADYQLEVSATQAAGEKINISANLTFTSSKEVVWTEKYEKVGVSSNEGLREVAEKVSMIVGDKFGVLLSDLRDRVLASGSDPQMTCRVKTLDILKHGPTGDHKEARNCLELELKGPHTTRETALLSSLIMHDYIDGMPSSKGNVDVDQSLRLANEAYETAPQKELNVVALASIMFIKGQVDTAMRMAENAISINPRSFCARASYASQLIRRGEFSKGADIIATLHQSGIPMPGWFEPYERLASYMLGNFKSGEQGASSNLESDRPLGLVMEALRQWKTGNSNAAHRALTHLKMSFPAYAANFAESFNRDQIATQISAKLLGDLRMVAIGNAS